MVMTKLKNRKYRCEMEHLLVGYVKQRDLELDTIKITDLIFLREDGEYLYHQATKKNLPIMRERQVPWVTQELDKKVFALLGNYRYYPSCSRSKASNEDSESDSADLEG
jgi:hypothetical protein